jgi:hypothetical protein
MDDSGIIWSRNAAVNMRLMLEDMSHADLYLKSTANLHSYMAILAREVFNRSQADAIGWASRA